MSTPHFSDSGITIYHGDALDVLRQLPDGSVDAVITDPPYGIDFQSNMRSERLPKIANDQRPFIWFLHDAYRVTKEGGCCICFCRWDTEDVFKMAMEAAGFRIKSQLVWDRVSHGMGDLKGAFAPRHDVMWFGVKGKFAFHDGRPASVIPARRVPGQQLVHPNEKPLDLMRALIEPTVPPGGVVLDPFMGSGATLIGAQSLGRHAIGIDLEERYCDIAAARLTEALEGVA